MASRRRPLLTVRAALILMLAAMIGGVAGALTYLGHRSWTGAVLAGGGAAGVALAVLPNIIGGQSS